MEKGRSTLVAVLLNLPAPGLGQLYCGRPWTAALFFALSFAHWAVFLLIWVAAHGSLSAALGGWMASSALVWIGSMLHAGWAARRAGAEYALKPYNLKSLYALVVLVCWAGHFGMFKLVGANWLTNLPLRSDGMTPTLLAGDWLRVDRRAATLAAIDRGDVVVALDPYDGQTWRVLRVVGLGGETVELGPNGVVIDGRPAAAGEPGAPAGYERRDRSNHWVEQTYVPLTEVLDGQRVTTAQHPNPTQRRSGRWQVAAGELLLLGDNRIRALDATAFGPIDRAALVGRVFRVWFSRDPQTGRPRPARKGLPIPAR
jgi:signal peptidase I